MSALMLFGLAVFLFFFGLFPYWFKLHKHLREILGCTCESPIAKLCLIDCVPRITRLGAHLPQRCVFAHISVVRVMKTNDVLVLFIAVGWVSTIRVLGDVFEIQGFFTWHLIMTIIICTVWVVLFVLTIAAFIKGKIFLAKPEEVIKDTVGPKPGDEESQDGASSDYHKEAHHH